MGLEEECQGKQGTFLLGAVERVCGCCNGRLNESRETCLVREEEEVKINDLFLFVSILT